MAINISSLPTQLIIGSQNWSQYISFSSGIQIGYPEYAMGSGLMIVQGTINLEFRADFVGLPSSPVYKLNPTHWRRGQTISIAVNNVVLPCSGGQLFLLKSPQYPNRDADGIAKMSLSVGCRLALESFPPEPSRNVAGVVAGVPTNRALIISRILNYINVPNTLGSIPYPIDYSLPKTDGNWIQFAGKIADSAGHYLRCRTDGVVVSEPIQLSYGASARGYLIGRDEKLWEAIGDVAEQPLELTIVTGVVQDVTPVDRSPQVVTEIQPAGVLFPDILLGQQNPTALFVAKRTTKTSEKTSQFYKTTETEIQPAGLLFPDILLGQQNPTVLFTSKRIEIIYTFTNGIVVSQKTDEIQPAGVLFPDILLGQQNPTALFFAKREEISWRSIKDGLWERTYKLLQPAGVLFPDIPLGQQNPTILVIAKSFVDDKDTSGPPTNVGDISDNTTADRQIKAEVYATQLAADPYRPRQRTIDVPYAVSVAQLSNYGSLINRMLTGRAFGWQFGGVLDIGLLPFQQVAVTFEGLIYYLRVDALQYAINGTEAYLLWNGIEVGTAAALTPNGVIFPLQIPLGNIAIFADSNIFAITESLGMINILAESIVYGITPNPILVNIFLESRG
jgi:hypothetical protein